MDGYRTRTYFKTNFTQIMTSDDVARHLLLTKHLIRCASQVISDDSVGMIEKEPELSRRLAHWSDHKGNGGLYNSCDSVVIEAILLESYLYVFIIAS